MTTSSMFANSSTATGIKYGVITGLLYVVLLALQYSFTAHNPIAFGAAKFGSFLLIIAAFVLCAREYRKQSGGYADFKSLVQVMTICIIITETGYSVFNFVYMKYVEPQFIDNLMSNFRLWFEQNGIPEEQIDAQIESMNARVGDPFSLKNNIIGLAQSIIFDGIIAFIIAAILKRPKPPFETETV